MDQETLAVRPTEDAWRALQADLPKVTIVPLAAFLASADGKTLSVAEKTDILRVASQLLMQDHIYPHLPYKQDRFGATPPHGATPMDKLNAIENQISQSGNLDFHIAMLDAFASVRDLHTAYFLPAGFGGAIAFLPFQVGFYIDTLQRGGKVRRFIVTRVMNTGSAEGFGDFRKGVELLDWDDLSMDDAVQNSAALRPGANDAAVALLGTSLLTLRPLSTSGIAAWGKPPFDKPLTTKIRYQSDGAQREITMPWGVGTGFDAGATIPNNSFSMSQDLCESWHAAKVLWCREELARVSPYSSVAHTTPVPLVTTTIPPFEIQFTGGVAVPGFVDPATLVSAKKPGAKFGYLRIRAFRTNDLDPTKSLLADLSETLEGLDKKAPDGLILDIRGNPGGDIKAAECLLQMLTPGRIAPALFHLANTQPILDILKSVKAGTAPQATRDNFAAWTDDAGGTPLPDGPRLTTGHPLTTEEQANGTGQIYQGPVVLLIDALTYSAAEIFAGGFHDNGIGKIIGVDPNTGGGGANVWHYADLAGNLPALGLPPRLKTGATMQIAIRRSSRRSSNTSLHPSLQPSPHSTGEPDLRFIEDVGVSCDILYDRTLDDMTSASPRLIGSACDLLADAPVHRIEAHLPLQVRGNIVNVTVTPRNLTRLEFLAGELPLLLSTPVTDNKLQTIAVTFPAGTNPLNFPSLKIRGFAGPDTGANRNARAAVQTVTLGDATNAAVEIPLPDLPEPDLSA